MSLDKIQAYYNKFNEEHRLSTKHGQVEFITTRTYIEKFAKKIKAKTILDVGAGTGRYSEYFFNLGYKVFAIEYVKHNLRTLQQRLPSIQAFQGDARNLKKFNDESFDITLLLGPMYHLFSVEDKIQALREAKRVTKKNGYIFVAYYMNEYAILKHGFIDGHIKDALKNGKIDSNFKIHNNISDLYSMERLSDIKHYAKSLNLKRKLIISTDGASDYIRQNLNAMDEETFNLFIKWNLSICEKPELIGASSHTLDILEKTD